MREVSSSPHDLLDSSATSFSGARGLSIIGPALTSVCNSRGCRWQPLHIICTALHHMTRCHVDSRHSFACDSPLLYFTRGFAKSDVAKRKCILMTLIWPVLRNLTSARSQIMGMLSLNRSPTRSAYLLVFRFGSISFAWREANLAMWGRTCAAGSTASQKESRARAPQRPPVLVPGPGASGLHLALKLYHLVPSTEIDGPLNSLGEDLTATIFGTFLKPCWRSLATKPGVFY